MKIYPFNHFKIRNFMTLLGIVVVTLALFLSRGQSPSWAAPEQNPQKQTVPPRPSPTSPVSSQPTVEPTLTPLPTSMSTTTTASTPPVQGEGEEEEDAQRPQQTPEPEDEQDDGETIPESPVEEEEPNQEEPSSSERANQNGSGQTQGGQSSTESSGEPDNPERNPDFLPADLSLRKMVSHPTLTVGSIVTLTTVISNSGPELATNVVIRDPLPITDLELLETTISAEGNYEAETGLWRIETIARSQSITMNLVVKVLEAGTLKSTAAVIQVDQTDPDSIPNNDLEIEDDQGSVSFVAMMNSETSPVQADNEPVTSASDSAPESVTLSGGVDVLYWLYGLILGAVFIVIGVFLVHRS